MTYYVAIYGKAIIIHRSRQTNISFEGPLDIPQLSRCYVKNNSTLHKTNSCVLRFQAGFTSRRFVYCETVCQISLETKPLGKV